MTNMYLATPAYTMVDSTKGSMTNRYQCAKEHLQNNVNYCLKTSALGVITAGTTIAAVKNKSFVNKLATKIGKLISKKPASLPKGTVGKVIIPNYAKKGKFALLVAGAAVVGGTLAHLISGYYFKKGQIDQKYTDSAKIESQTKNVILESKLAAQDVNELKTQNARGLYC